MKKPSRSASKKTTKKPVTIELKAESVTPAPKTKSASKTSVPRTSGKSASSAKNTSSKSKPTEKPASKKPADTSKSGSVFGRGNENKTSAEKPQKKPEPNTSSNKPSELKAPSKPKSNSAMNRFAAALIGGVVALGGAGALQYAGILGSPNASSSVSTNALTDLQKEMDEKITALQSSVKDISSNSTPVLDKAGVESLVDSKIAKIPQQTGSNDSDLDAVTTQVNETTVRVESLQSEIAALTKTVAGLTKTLDSSASGSSTGLTSLTSRIDDVSGKLESLTAEFTGLKADTLEIANKPAPEPAELSKTVAGLTALQTAFPALKSDFDGKLSKFSADLESIKTTTAQQSSVLKDMEAKVAISENVKKTAASAIAAAALKSDIDRGIPFNASLETLQQITGTNEALTELEKYAETGVPTISQLSSSFGAVGEKIIAALAPKPKDDLASRLVAGAKSFVSIKPVGPVEGNTPAALVSRLSSVLKSGKASEAAEIWAKIPENGQTASADWHNQLQARISTNSLIDSTVQSYIQSSATQ